MTTVAKLLKHDFSKGNLNLFDTNGNQTYREDSSGFWYKYEYDSNSNKTYYENSNGSWYKKEYDTNGKLIYFENSTRYWAKYEYDINGKLIYYENPYGTNKDNRPKPNCSGKTVTIDGIEYELKEKK